MVIKKEKTLQELQAEVQELEIKKSQLSEKIGEIEIEIKKISLEQQKIVTIVNQAVLDAYKAQAFSGGLIVPSGGSAQIGDKKLSF